ncbi:MAG: hypothetical protein CMJ58_08500 [Planctomycetaceae bacterium]|nr:hypothetical protein [Planctomycetaceae bacterium]
MIPLHSAFDADACWRQQEEAIARLHDAARTAISARAFYARAIDEFAACWGPAPQVAVWLATSGGDLQKVGESAGGAESARPADETTRRAQVALKLANGQPDSPRGRLWQTIPNAIDPAHPHGVIEIAVSGEASTEQLDSLQDFASAVAAAASDFHAFSALRSLSTGDDALRRSGPLVRGLQRESRLEPLGYVAANEGRRLLGCERLTVLLRRGRRWRALAVSGVDHVEARTEFTRRAEGLAARIADWGEPLSAGEFSAGPTASDDLPPPLTEVTAAYLDATHARTLAAAPVAFPLARQPDSTGADQPRTASRADAVFLAEWFSAAGPADAAVQTAELAELCAGALGRAAALDGPLTRRLVRRAQHQAETRRAGLPKWAWAIAAIAVAVAALTFIPTTFEAAAPATLLPVDRQELFAPVSGRVAEVRAQHGQTVDAGEVLAVIDAPELQLQWQQVIGELETVSRRIDALAVARTERGVREQTDAVDGLPPGAEQLQLIERRTSLQRQRDLLAQRREELTIRSPLAGVVLTRDVESLLAGRPVERGQALLTVADPAGAWELIADVDQRDIGHVVAAQQSSTRGRPVRFRLPGDVDRVRTGRVASIDAAAPLDTTDLNEPSPPVDVHVAVDADQLDEGDRPGLEAEVRIDCGRRSLAYVWLHDVAAAAYRWWSF